MIECYDCKWQGSEWQSHEQVTGYHEVISWSDPAYEEYDDGMDGDHQSALASAGWGNDEDYGYYGDDTYA